jgi:hypothetical protein
MASSYFVQTAQTFARSSLFLGQTSLRFTVPPHALFKLALRLERASLSIAHSLVGFLAFPVLLALKRLLRILLSLHGIATKKIVPYPLGLVRRVGVHGWAWRI